MLIKVKTLTGKEIEIDIEPTDKVERIKERMSCLEQMQKDLAEFFCEDPNSFKLNECYKSMWEFCLKFKQVSFCQTF